MSNQNRYSRKPEKRPMDAAAAQHRWMGYEDYKAGLGFRADYESFTPWNQRNYEAGRQFAAVTAGVVGSVPKWPRNRKLSAVLSAALGDVAARANAVEINRLFRPAPAVTAQVTA